MRTVGFMLPLNRSDKKSYNNGTSLPLSRRVLSHSLCPEVWLLFDLLIFEKISKHYDEAWPSCAVSPCSCKNFMQYFIELWQIPLVRQATVWSFSICRRQAQGGADRFLRWSRNTRMGAGTRIRCPESLCSYYDLKWMKIENEEICTLISRPFSHYHLPPSHPHHYLRLPLIPPQTLIAFWNDSCLSTMNDHYEFVDLLCSMASTWQDSSPSPPSPFVQGLSRTRYPINICWSKMMPAFILFYQTSFQLPSLQVLILFLIFYPFPPLQFFPSF